MINFKKIKKDDEVMIISGKDVGKTGKVIEIDRKKGKVMVEGLNLVKKTMKKSNDNPNGAIIDIEAMLSISNVMILDPKTKEPTRVGFKVVDGKKKRFAKKSGTVID